MAAARPHPGRSRLLAVLAGVVAASLVGAALVAAPGAALAADASSPPAGEAEVLLTPSILELAPGETAVLEFIATTPVPASSVTTDVLFDESKLEITAIELGPAWATAALLVGEAGELPDAAIATANRDGRLVQAGGILLPGMGELPVGRNVVLTITVTATAQGPTQLALSEALILDATASPMPIAGTAGAGIARPTVEAAAPFPWPSVLLLLALLLAVAGCAAVGTRAVPPERLREGPFVASSVLAAIPVTVFVAFGVMLVVLAAPSLEEPGLTAMLRDQFSSNFSLSGATNQWGLIPAAWGTLLITVLAVVIALPVSLAMAIVATEFPAGPLGRLLQPLLGVFAGIPPIVYAVAGAVFVTLFVAPKFAGSAERTSFDPARLGVAPSAWPPPDVPFTDTSFPWAPNIGGLPSSTLLGAILIALLVIPFMAPLIWDAMRNVPSAAREASVALGATRWYTVRRVLLRHAMPGIVAAVALATLKALGDVLIIGLAVGWQAEQNPVPLWDVLERTSTLAAEGANLLGNLQAAGSSGACQSRGANCSVGYASAVVLLAGAAAIVLSASVLEGRLRRRLGQ